jgi:hypothetical protein
MTLLHAPSEPLVRLLQLPGEGHDDELARALRAANRGEGKGRAGGGEETPAIDGGFHGGLPGQMAKVRSKSSTSAPRWGAIFGQSMVWRASTSSGVEGV